MRRWTKFDQDNFILVYFDKDWDNIICKEREDNSFDNFLTNINELLDKHATLKKLNKQKQKFYSKPWITSAIQVSIRKKTSYLNNSSEKKNS